MTYLIDSYQMCLNATTCSWAALTVLLQAAWISLLEALHQWRASDRHHFYLCLLLFATIRQRQTFDTFTGHPQLVWEGLMSLRKNKCPAWEWGQQVLFPKILSGIIVPSWFFHLCIKLTQHFSGVLGPLEKTYCAAVPVQKVEKLQQGSLPPSCTSGLSILFAQSHFTHNNLCLCHFIACSPEILSSGNLHICAWLQQIKLLLRVSGQSAFPATFSRNFLPLPSPNTPEAFEKYPFLAFDNLSFRFFLPAEGFLGRLTDITSPSFQNRPDAGVMGWELCLP